MAWDLGVLLFLLLSAQLFVTEPPERMPAAAEAQQEGEWTIFWLTLAVVIVSFVAVSSEFAAHQAGARGAKSMVCGAGGGNIVVSWLMTHVTFRVPLRA